MLNDIVKVYKEVAEVMFPCSVTKETLIRDLVHSYEQNIAYSFSLQTYGNPSYLDITEGVETHTYIADCNGILPVKKFYDLVGKCVSADLFKVNVGNLDYKITITYVGTFNEYIISKNHSDRWNNVMNLILPRFTSNPDLFLGTDSVIFSGNLDSLIKFLGNFSVNALSDLDTKIAKYKDIVRLVTDNLFKDERVNSTDSIEVLEFFDKDNIEIGIFLNSDRIGSIKLDELSADLFSCDLPDALSLYIPLLVVTKDKELLGYFLYYNLVSDVYHLGYTNNTSICDTIEDLFNIKIMKIVDKSDKFEGYFND